MVDLVAKIYVTLWSVNHVATKDLPGTAVAGFGELLSKRQNQTCSVLDQIMG